MSILRRVASQASFYLAAEVLGQLAGFISFPIFTRVFTQAQYGVMGLVDATFKFAGTISGMGLRPAVVRLWGEFKEGQREGGTRVLASTLLSATFLIGLASSVLLLTVLLLPDHLLQREARHLIAMAAAVVVFRNVNQMVMSIVQSQEKAALRAGMLVAERYLVLGCTLFCVVVLDGGLRGFFIGVLVGEGLLFCFSTGYALTRLSWRPRWWNAPVVRESMLYGLPLLGTNMAGFITDLGDRYLLEYFRGSTELGFYNAGYQLSTYATMFFGAALTSALIPVTMNAWAEKGPEETSRTLESFLRYFALVALPVVFGVTAVGEDLIGFLAGDKWIPAAVVLPWVLSAKVIYGAYYPFLAGLFLSKRTGVVALFLAGAAALNIGLNLLMIPPLGMRGAAITTLLAYAFYVFGGGLFSQRYLRLRIPVRSLLAYLAASAAMYLLLSVMPSLPGHLLNLLVKVPLGAAIYMLLAVWWDSEARDILSRLRGRLRRRG